MNKTWIILRSEFGRRVGSGWFLASTFLVPIFIVALIVAPGLFMYWMADSDEREIAVIDETDVLLDRLQAEDSEHFSFHEDPRTAEALRHAVREGEYDGFLYLEEQLIEGTGAAQYYSTSGGGFAFRSRIEGLVGRAVELHRLEAVGAPSEVVDIIRGSPTVSIITLTDDGEHADATPALSAVGYVMGFFVWMAVLMYGSLVMSSVIEEKTSRVMEVVVSSVRPFQLLLGKVLGIGAAGLLQMAAWGILILGIAASAGAIAGLFLDPATVDLAADASSEAVLDAAGIIIPTIPVSLVVWFVLFFLGGYLLYASLYAAIGSAVEEHQDAQTMAFPIMFLLFIPIVLLAMVIENPESTASFILSMIPFFSPVLMVVREAVADIPFWQVALSFSILVATFLASIWISSRIYRVGILMYGKKASFRELGRWLLQG